MSPVMRTTCRFLSQERRRLIDLICGFPSRVGLHSDLLGSWWPGVASNVAHAWEFEGSCLAGSVLFGRAIYMTHGHMVARHFGWMRRFRIFPLSIARFRMQWLRSENLWRRLGDDSDVSKHARFPPPWIRLSMTKCDVWRSGFARNRQKESE